MLWAINPPWKIKGINSLHDCQQASSQLQRAAERVKGLGYRLKHGIASLQTSVMILQQQHNCQRRLVAPQLGSIVASIAKKNMFLK
jgi:hypothetical protein